jgi:glutathione S-transferase
MGQAILYGIPGSHAVRAGQLMLEHKGIPFRRRDFVPCVHRVRVRMLGFRGDRVPAVRFVDGSRAQGTRPLARALDERQPEPRLVPGDPRVEEAERWGDKVLQQWARRMVASVGARDCGLLAERAGAGRLGPLLTCHDRQRRTMLRLVLMGFRVTREQRRDDELRVGEMLDRVDAWIADGVLNGERPTSADFLIAPSLALVDYRLDVRDELRARPAAALMERVLPEPS